MAALAGCAAEPDVPTWRYVHAAVLQPACATAACHSKLASLAGVDLSTPDAAYAVLVGRICGEPARPQDPGRNFVTPFSAAYSQLVYQLRGQGRDLMPPGAPLPPVEVELVERWIDAGAACD